MRMTHYFGALAILVIPALCWTAWTGAFGMQQHVGVGLFSAVLAAGAHSLLILFMIVTGRVLKEAMAARPLSPEFLAELNQFFAKKKAYPLAIFAVVSIAVAAVLGYAPRGFGISPACHWVAGIGAVVFNLLVIPLEIRALRENQTLIDRAAAELDRLDRVVDRLDRVNGPRDLVDDSSAEELDAYDPKRAARWGLIVALSAWFPYMYWSLVVWKGQFARLPWGVHPWLEISLFGVAVWFIARREIPRAGPS